MWKSDDSLTSTYLTTITPLPPSESGAQLARFDHVVGMGIGTGNEQDLKGRIYLHPNASDAAHSESCAPTPADCAVSCLLVPLCASFQSLVEEKGCYGNWYTCILMPALDIEFINRTVSPPLPTMHLYFLPQIMPSPSPPPPPNPSPSPPPPTKPAVSTYFAAGEAAALLICLLVVLRLSSSGRRLARELRTLLESQYDTDEFSYDLFVSYRRVDFLLADQIASYCRESWPGCPSGLRVFKDREDDMVGQPFDLFLFDSIANCAVFTPIISLEAMERLTSVTAHSVDWTLVEYILALHFKQTGRLRGIVPLLVGRECELPDGASWSHLPHDAEFKALRNAVPALVPVASLDVARSLLHASDPAASLAPGLEGATVLDLMEASSSDGSLQLRGLLQHDWHTLEGRLQGLKGQMRVFAAVVMACAQSLRTLGGGEEGVAVEAAVENLKV